jgi:hypothetical protein
MWPDMRRVCATLPQARVRAAVVEALEQRRLLTGIPGAATDDPPIVLYDGTVVQQNENAELKDGVLTVHAYDGRHNTIAFYIYGSGPGGLVVGYEHQVSQFGSGAPRRLDGPANFYDTQGVGFANIPVADLKEIHVIGGTGADDIAVIPNLNLDNTIGIPFEIPVRFEGGAGDDTLIGGQGTDTLIGGAGKDWIDGGASHWLDREWLNQGWQGTDTLRMDLPRIFVGDDTLGGGVQGEVLDGEADGNDMPAPPSAPDTHPVAVQPAGPLTEQPAPKDSLEVIPAPVNATPFSIQPMPAANGPAVLGDPADTLWDVLN